jgi:DNA-binding response OmpR family regulator
MTLYPNPGLSPSLIASYLWDGELNRFSYALSGYVAYLRKKLKIAPDSPQLISPVRDVGYILGTMSDKG